MKIFNKYMLIFAAAPMLWACSADEGTMPGSDSNPVVTLYSYAPTAEGTNPDNDVLVRFATNSQVTSVKYLLVPSADALALIENGGRKALLDKVESEGTVVENLGANGNADIMLTEITGSYTIAAVANGATLSNLVDFTGLSWTTLHEGVYDFNKNEVFGANAPYLDVPESTEVTLDICDNDKNLYRLNNIFGEGTSLKLDMLDLGGEDELGKFRLFRVKQTLTPYAFGSNGLMSVRDIGYWQNNEAFVTGGGYENYLYENGYIDVCLQWNVPAGNCGYAYSSFTPLE